MKQHSIIDNNVPTIGEGIYLIKDVANILLLPYSKVRHLMKGFWYSNAFGNDNNLAINFFSLIEFYTFFKLRELGVSASDIKKAHTILARDLNVKYPFALSGIESDGKKIWYDSLDGIIKVDGKKQFVIKECIKEFLTKIEFGKNNIAKKFFPIKDSKLVVVDPLHQFGQPTIYGRNITISAIKKLHDGGETIKDIAIIYDINDSQVAHALKYFKRVA